jgi:hypothetical protein
MALTPPGDPADPLDDPADPPEPTTAEEQKIEQISTLVLARIEQKIEQKIEHLHMPMAVPSASEAAQLKSQAPEVYDLWLDLTREKARDDAAVQRLPFEHPFQLARRGQWFGIVALMGVLGFCAYLASIGGGVAYVAGVIAALDLVAIISSFMAIARSTPPPHQ